MSKENYQAAIERLNMLIAEEPNNANWRYMRGKIYWRLGERGKAITDYEYAVSLDPNSPAKNALSMSNEIMGFFNPDLFNP